MYFFCVRLIYSWEGAAQTAKTMVILYKFWPEYDPVKIMVHIGLFKPFVCSLTTFHYNFVDGCEATADIYIIIQKITERTNHSFASHLVPPGWCHMQTG